MNFSHRSRNPQNVPNTKDETIHRQFERFERIRVFADGYCPHDAIISNSSRPCPSNLSQKPDLCNRQNKRITNEELLGIRTLQNPSDTQFSTVESSRVSSQGGSPRRAPLTGTINQDLMDRLDAILDAFSLPKSVQ